ncbi:transporter [Acinetobacter nectaris]|uniref:transporter n=1 Tax=Acinetobacter nectaris TaxID=1219382 RepID=UPI001F278B37|nr:transporter [Acinetobacter nectaris]
MMKTKYQILIAALAAYAEGHAAEVMPGDYEQYPANATIGVLYYQNMTTNDLYANGTKLGSDYKVVGNLGIARLLHVYQLNDQLTVDPQFLLPFGQLRSKDSATNFGKASGVGDLTLAAPLKYKLNDRKDTLSGVVYLTIPTGSYEKNNPLNIGANRWKYDFQGAYIKHFTPKFALDITGDIVLYGNNNEYGTNSYKLKTNNSYEFQVMGRYMPSQITSFGIGLGHTWGAENTVNGLPQNDDIKTTNIRLYASHFFGAKDQLQVQVGRDLSVSNGLKEDFHSTLRYAHIF